MRAMLRQSWRRRLSCGVSSAGFGATPDHAARMVPSASSSKVSGSLATSYVRATACPVSTSVGDCRRSDCATAAGTFRGAVETDAEHGRRGLRPECVEAGRRFAARPAPAGPEMHDDRFAAVLGQAQVAAVGCLQDEVRGGGIERGRRRQYLHGGERGCGRDHPNMQHPPRGTCVECPALHLATPLSWERPEDRWLCVPAFRRVCPVSVRMHRCLWPAALSNQAAAE